MKYKPRNKPVLKFPMKQSPSEEGKETNLQKGFNAAHREIVKLHDEIENLEKQIAFKNDCLDKLMTQLSEQDLQIKSLQELEKSEKQESQFTEVKIKSGQIVKVDDTQKFVFGFDIRTQEIKCFSI